MKLLVVNPNTSPSVTRVIDDAARAAAAPGTEIETVNASFGARYISSRAENTIAGHATIAALAAHCVAQGADIDAAVIAAFTDPGLAAARELMPFPVVGIAEAAMLTACMLGGRFAIVTIAPRLLAVIRETVEGYGLGRRFAGARAIIRPTFDIASNQTAVADALLEAARAAVREDGAEVVILGGAPVAGLERRLAESLEVPLLDGVGCAVRQAEVLVGLRPRKPVTGSYRPPDAKELVGVSDDLAQLFDK